MRRRVVAIIITFVLGILAGPPVPHAQQATRVARIGWLGFPTREVAEPVVQAFRRGLKDLGWVEGQNIVIEWRFAGGRAERLPELAAELVGLRVDLIVVPNTPTALAAKNATKTIPIVTGAVGDPVGLGLVASLARPGGNITGLTAVVSPEIAGKQLELLQEAVPKASRVAVLWNPATPGSEPYLREAEIAARALHVQLQRVGARTSDEFADAFAAMARERAGAFIVLGDPMFFGQRTRLADLARRVRLPAMYSAKEYAQAGGLMSHGPVLADLYRRAATYVDKILKGAKPGDLPVEQPMKFELVVNLKAAKAIGLTIPRSFLLRADQVIE